MADADTVRNTDARVDVVSADTYSVVDAPSYVVALAGASACTDGIGSGICRGATIFGVNGGLDVAPTDVSLELSLTAATLTCAGSRCCGLSAVTLVVDVPVWKCRLCSMRRAFLYFALVFEHVRMSYEVRRGLNDANIEVFLGEELRDEGGVR